MSEHYRQQGPVQTSAVYLVGRRTQPVEPPPSPPSPPSPGPDLCCGVAESLEEPPSLSLDNLPSRPPISPQATAAHLPSSAPSPPVEINKLTPASPTVTAPPSPSTRPLDDVHDGWASPPDCNPEFLAADRLAGAVHVLNAEAAAVASLATLYSTSPGARAAFDSAVSVIARNQERHSVIGSGTAGSGGTLVMIGVGKSGHIARKLAATFSSLSLRASFMHPTEALHGDLGLLNPGRDAVIMVSFSGKTPELLGLVPHLHPKLPVVVITSASEQTCEIARVLNTLRKPTGIQCAALEPGCPADLAKTPPYQSDYEGEVVVLPAPIPTSEVASFGVAAPTASTTAALALGDALAIVAAKEIHGSTANMAVVFSRNHPGGAIGAAVAAGALR